MRILTIISLLLFSTAGFARTITVGASEKITSVKSALSVAAPFDTILVKKGTYREGSIVITMPLTVIGIDNPVLDGENKYETIIL